MDHHSTSEKTIGSGSDHVPNTDAEVDQQFDLSDPEVDEAECEQEEQGVQGAVDIPQNPSSASSASSAYHHPLASSLDSQTDEYDEPSTPRLPLIMTADDDGNMEELGVDDGIAFSQSKFAGTLSPPPNPKNRKVTTTTHTPISARRVIPGGASRSRVISPPPRPLFSNTAAAAQEGGSPDDQDDQDDRHDRHELEVDNSPVRFEFPHTDSSEQQYLHTNEKVRHERVGKVTPIKRREGQIALVVGFRRFIVNSSLFSKHPNTMLGRMFGSSLDMNLTRPNDNGDYVIAHDVSPAAFNAVLNFYKDGQIRCPPNVSVAELHEACNFFLIPFTHKSVKCENLGTFLSELSNRGARDQFVEFLEECVVPAMARSAHLGERECHIVCLGDTDTIEWDDDLPPALGEQYYRLVHNTSLVRYLKYHQNRDIGKQVLKERGLKKILFGIEGFPTYVEKIRYDGQGEKIEAIYNYEQRPFIRLSWEQEEGKSRHVDFQCVRARSISTKQ